MSRDRVQRSATLNGLHVEVLVVFDADADLSLADAAAACASVAAVREARSRQSIRAAKPVPE